MIHFTSRHPSGFLEVILFYYVQLKKHDYGYGIPNFNYTMFGKYVLWKLRNFSANLKQSGARMRFVEIMQKDLGITKKFMKLSWAWDSSW